MKNLATFLFIVIFILTILVFLTRPELLDKIWLWLIGLIGPIIAFFEKAASWVKDQFNNTSSPDKNSPAPALKPAAAPANSVAVTATPTAPAPAAAINNSAWLTEKSALEQKIIQLESQLAADDTKSEYYGNNTLTVLRYIDDGQTTLGLLFLRKKFFAYTLEDTHRDEKLAGETRIPSGIYRVDFNKAETGLTLKYRKDRPWFDYHLEIKNVPNYKGIYIHVGNSNADTKGCLLVADGVDAASKIKMINSSKLAFERFYKTISALLKSGESVSVRILDEDWFERSKLISA